MVGLKGRCQPINHMYRASDTHKKRANEYNNTRVPMAAIPHNHTCMSRTAVII